jgi:flagellar biosynthesis/type III secretory pathway M-ring protein FliF/YscJ
MALEPSGAPAIVLVISPWVYVAEFLVLWLIWFWILGTLRRRFSKKR